MIKDMNLWLVNEFHVKGKLESSIYTKAFLFLVDRFGIWTENICNEISF